MDYFLRISRYYLSTIRRILIWANPYKNEDVRLLGILFPINIQSSKDLQSHKKSYHSNKIQTGGCSNFRYGIESCRPIAPIKDDMLYYRLIDKTNRLFLVYCSQQIN